MSNLHDFLNHPIETLERALHIRKQIDQLNEMLKALFGPSPVSLAGVQTSAPKRRGRPPKAKVSLPGVVAPVAKAKKVGISAAGRARIAAAQKARWAKVKAGQPAAPQATAPKKKKKGTISPEGLARIKAAQKLRWAKFRKAKK